MFIASTQHHIELSSLTRALLACIVLSMQGGVVHVAPDGSTYVEYPGGVTNVQVPPSSPQTGSG